MINSNQTATSITVLFSNRSKVYFEIYDDLVYRRMKLFGETEQIDLADIVLAEDETRYELILSQDPVEVRKREKHNIDAHNTEKEMPLWKEIIVDDSRVVLYRSEIATKFHLIMFFIDLDQIGIPQLLNKEFWFKNDSELFLYMDTFKEDSEVYPISVVQEQHFEVSHELRNLLLLLPNN